MNISVALKEARKNSGMNQGQFSKEHGLSQTYISQIENGKKIPSLEVVAKYQKSSKIPLAVILWSALEEKDVKKDKIKEYKVLKPIIDELISLIFLTPQHNK
jgi:transcriptional regulator with XRE-family HTH domain